MNDQRISPGEMVNLTARTHAAKPNEKTILVQNREVEVCLLRVQAGSTIPTYEAAGQITLQCLEGRLLIHARATSQGMARGDLLYFTLNEAFSMSALEDSAVLATVVHLKRGDNVSLIGTTQ